MRVSEDHWRDGIKFLMGQGTGPTLTSEDQKKLREVLRGPFANGMSAAEATRYLRDGLHWEKS